LNNQFIYQLSQLIPVRGGHVKLVIACLFTLILLVASSNTGYSQIKLSDKKSNAYKQSRKNKTNKKKKKRDKRYKNASKQNLSTGDIEVIPEILKEKYVPKNQNVEKNPSKQKSNSRRKQNKIYTKKANEAKRQGLTSKDTYSYRNRNFRKQSRTIAGHQGNITVQPYALRSRQGLFIQPPIDDTPGRTNKRVRNEKLATYSQKSEEASMQGLIKGRSKKDKQIGYIEKSTMAQSQGMYRVKSGKPNQDKRRSNKVAFHQGNLKYNAKRKDDVYMGKSVESLSQGLTIKNKSLKDNKQRMQSNSMMQSQYQGGLKFNRKMKEESYMMKSIEAQRQGFYKNKEQKSNSQIRKFNSMLHAHYQGDLKYNHRKRDDTYMMKSVEAQQQGLSIKNKSLKDNKQRMQSNSLTQSQFQGGLKYNKKKRDETYMMKSIEAQQQGLSIKNKSLKDNKQRMQSNSLVQSQFQGGLKYNRKKREETYMIKSVEALQQGLTIKKKSLKDNKQMMQSNSLTQSQYQGGLVYSRKMTEDKYIKKSIEMQRHGLTIKSKALKDNKQMMQSNSLAQSQYQGELVGKSKRQKDQSRMFNSVYQTQFQGNVKSYSQHKKESVYIRKSIEMSNQGLISVKKDSRKEDIYMGKSVEMLSQGLYKGTSIHNKESLYIRKSIEASNIGLYKGQTKSQIYADLKRKSGEYSSYSGDVKFISKNKKDAQLRAASNDAMSYKGDSKVRAQFFDNLYFKRLSNRQKKFDGMKYETKINSWWASIWKKPSDQKKGPQPLKKPRYDSKEHEIWFY